MNNDDFMRLVLSELKDLKQGQAGLEARFDGFRTETNNHFDTLEARLGAHDARFDTLEAETAGIRQSVARIEIEHGKHLSALHDGYTLLYDKVAPLPETNERLKNDVSVIKLAVTSHSGTINALRKIK